MDNLIYLLVPVLATIAGGTIAAFRPPGATLRGMVQHFAAGVVFAAVAVELLPEMMDEGRPFAVVVGFALGVALMLGVRELTESKPEQQELGASASTSLVVTVAVDIFIDGLLIGIGFAAGEEAGLLITVAMTLEVLFLGLALAGSMAQAGQEPSRIIGTSVGLAVLLAVGAVIGMVVLGELPGAPFTAILAFGVAALLYLVTEELLIEAHEEPETPVTTAVFFVGFLVLLVIGMMV